MFIFLKKIELNELLAPLTGHFTLKLTWKMKKQCFINLQKCCHIHIFPMRLGWDYLYSVCACMCARVCEWTFKKWTIRIRQILQKYPQLCTKDGKKKCMGLEWHEVEYCQSWQFILLGELSLVKRIAKCEKVVQNLFDWQLFLEGKGSYLTYNLKLFNEYL